MEVLLKKNTIKQLKVIIEEMFPEMVGNKGFLRKMKTELKRGMVNS